MNNPQITIFIPTYRRPYLLKQAIESALNQTYKEVQVFICDNASNDETSKIVKKLAKKDPRIVYFCHPKNIGMLANYEFGIAKIKTEYFSILSDDDILLPCFCETALKNFSQHPEITFFAGSSLMITRQGEIFRAPLEDWPREGIYYPPESLLEMIGKYPVPTTVMFRTATVSEAKIDYQNIVAWDCDFLIQLASKYPIAISKQPCGYYVSHPNSFSGKLTFPASLNSILRLGIRVRSFSWVDNTVKAKASILLRKDYWKTALIHLVFLFAIKRFKGAILTCLKLVRHRYMGKKVFIYFIMCSICYPFPFLHRFFVSLQKLKAILTKKRAVSSDPISAKFKGFAGVNLVHFEKQPD